MSRAWRIEYEGALYHILSRGNDQKEIFYEDQDRLQFLETIGEMSERYETDIFAYVLMGNHYHLLLRTNRANLSKAMQWLGVTYTRRFNIRHFRSGHLFQGRFKSIIVQNDAYLMQLSCYVHRNPLRAGVVERLVDYRWSSYKVYAYGHKAPKWLSTNLILSQFTSEESHKAYREKVQSYAKEEKRLWEDLRYGIVLGTKNFVDKIRSAYLPEKPHREIPQQRNVARGVDTISLLREVAKIIDCDLTHFKESQRISKSEKNDRDLLVFFVWKSGLLTNEAIGDLFGVTYSSISHIVSSMKSRLKKDRRLNNKFNRIYSQFKI